MKLLGVDYGKIRTGLAVSDVAGITCRPLAVITERDLDRLVAVIVDAAREHEAEGIVVGIPRPLSGGTNQQMQDVSMFMERLSESTSLPVTEWDERFTSVLAETGAKGSEARDSVAACYMLQNYLDMLAARKRS